MKCLRSRVPPFKEGKLREITLHDYFKYYSNSHGNQDKVVLVQRQKQRSIEQN